MRHRRVRSGGWTLRAVCTVPAKAEHLGSSHKFRVFLLSSRWVPATGIAVIPTKYGDSTRVPRSTVTTFAGTISSRCRESFAKYRWVEAKSGGQSAGPRSIASILLRVILTKSVSHLELFRNLRSARTG